MEVENFRSIRDRLKLSFIAPSRGTDLDRFARTVDGQHVSKLTVLVGANGSGKSNILRAITFTLWFMQSSFREMKPGEAIPVEAFAGLNDEPSVFRLDLQVERTLWRYELALTRERVHREALYRYQRTTKRWRHSYVFVREWDKAARRYITKQRLDIPQEQALKVPPNVSLLATAAQYGIEAAVELTTAAAESNIHRAGKFRYGEMSALLAAADYLHEHPDTAERVSKLLAAWDTGLVGSEMERIPQRDAQGADKTSYMPFGLHKRMDGKGFRLPFLLESSGTQAAYVLLSRLLPVLEQGGLAIMDEMESDLHPAMMIAIAELFLSPQTNPHDAQLICATHAHQLLTLLHKAQIVLVEKDESLNTEAWRLDQVQGVRADENYFAKYMAGAYGAVPELD